MLSFLLLGYPPLLSLFLGTAGGYAMGVIVSWWHAQDEPQPLEEALSESIENLPHVNEKQQSIVAKMRLESQRKSRRRRRRQQRSSSLLGWLLGKSDRL